MFTFGFGMSREWFGSLVRDLLWYDGGNVSNNYSSTSRDGNSNNESDDNSDILLGNLPMALPSPFEPQSETVLGTAILGIDSVEDKSHSRQHDNSRNSARYGAISGSEQYELVINTNDETDNPNETSSNNNRQTQATNNDNDAEEDENHQHHITNNNDDKDNNNDDYENEEEQNVRCTNCNKRQRELEKANTHQRVDNNNNYPYEEIEEMQTEEEEENDQRNQHEGRAKETAPQHSVPLLISVASSANTDTESNTNTNTVTNANSNNNNGNTNVLSAHTQLASASASSLSMFSPLPVIPRFPSLSLMSDSDHSNNLQNINNYNNYCNNENMNVLPPPNLPADTHTTSTETRQNGLPALRSTSFASSLSLHNSAPESVEHSESIIPLRSWRSRMLGLCGLRPRTRHRDWIAASNQSNNNNINTSNSENANRRGNRNVHSESNSDSSSNNNNNKRTSHEQEAVIDTYNVLNGGYVVFTDDYVKAHPNSTISIITSAYKSLNESGSDNSNKEPVNLLEQNVRRSKLQEVRKCIAEVQDLQRPLFKRRNSDLVYGRASYHTRCEGDNNDVNFDKNSIIINKNNDKLVTDHHIIVNSETGDINSNNDDEQKQKDENTNNIVLRDDDCNENVYKIEGNKYKSHDGNICKHECNTTNIV